VIAPGLGPSNISVASQSITVFDSAVARLLRTGPYRDTSHSRVSAHIRQAIPRPYGTFRYQQYSAAGRSAYSRGSPLRRRRSLDHWRQGSCSASALVRQRSTGRYSRRSTPASPNRRIRPRRRRLPVRPPLGRSASPMGSHANQLPKAGECAGIGSRSSRLYA